MIYQWKIPGLLPVDAQTAGEELERIYQERGGIEPSTVVEESRDISSPLHPCFEWDDAVAAEKYREDQARLVIRSIVTVSEDSAEKQQPVRAFVRVQEDYKPITVVLNDEEQMEELLRSALLELSAFRKKYQALSALRPVFAAIESISA